MTAPACATGSFISARRGSRRFRRQRRPGRLPRPLRAGGAGAILLAAVAACSTASHPPAPDPAAHVPAPRLLGDAITTLKKAPAVRMTGIVISAGQRISFRLTDVPGTGCTGSITVPGKGAARVIVKGTAAWVEPSGALWAASGIPAGMLAKVTGKYLAVAQDPAAAGVPALCALSSLAVPPGTLTEHGTITVGGARALVIDGPHDSTFWVTQATVPQLLRVSGAAPAPGAMNFTVLQAAPPISVPLPGDVLSVSMLTRDGLPG